MVSADRSICCNLAFCISNCTVLVMRTLSRCFLKSCSNCIVNFSLLELSVGISSGDSFLERIVVALMFFGA